MREEKIWDNFWQGWLNKFVVPFRFIVDNLYIFEIKKYANGRILELGCGTSYCSRKLNTYGLDTSKKIISKRNRGKFVLGDAKKLPFKNDSFNLVWSAGLLEHLIPPDDVILESKRVAKTFIAFVPSNIEPLGRMKNVYGKMVIHSKKTFYVLLKKFFDKVEVKRYHLTIMGLGIDKK